MKKWGFGLLFVFLILFSILIGASHLIHAQEATPTPIQSGPTPTPTPDSSSNTVLTDLQKRIKETEEKVSELQKQEKTLFSQIAVMDSQIRLSELRINATKQELTELGQDIEKTTQKISDLEEALDSLTKVLINRIIATYQIGSIQPLQILLSSSTVSDFFTRANYLKIAQIHDKKLIYETQQAKIDYINQKEIFEDKKEKVEALKKQLETYTARLDQEKKSKETLLQVTKNDEQKYQQLLARLRADAESIRRALSSGGIKIGPVKKGERIASVGNSGCSTGPHLHLEVMTPAHVEDGIVIGRENKVDPKPYIDSEQFPKPTSSYTGKDCSTGGMCYFGDITTTFKQWYNILGGSYHTGLDIADYSGASIYAAADGIAYSTQDTAACGITGTVGKGIIIDHQNGMVTLYWHIP